MLGLQFKKFWFAEIYKTLPCIFQATNEVVFLLVAYKTEKKCSVKIYVKIRTDVLARNACEYGVTCDTGKS